MQTKNLRSVFSKLIHIAGDILFPDRCVACFSVGQILCDHCLFKLETDFHDPTPNILTIFNYHHKIVKKLIWHLKFKRAEPVATIFAPYLEETILNYLTENLPSFSYQDQILLVPIPLHQKRLKARGYNQSKILSQKISHLNPNAFTVADILIKTRNTPTQVSCHKRHLRQKNIKNSFVLQTPINLSNKIVCVIDDVTTTGATLEEALMVIQQGKPKHIFAVTLAHG